MILFWRISCLDTTDRQFKDRDLWLDTDELDATTKAAVEACYESRRDGDGRAMLKFRRLFQEGSAAIAIGQRVTRSGGMKAFSLNDYHEDEAGNALSGNALARALTGSETAALVPHGARSHDIEYMLAAKPSVDVSQLSLSVEQCRILGYFARDLRELMASTLFKEGPGTLKGATLETAVDDEEIRSFLTIFRRLYMEKEPANFAKAVNVYATVLSTHPAGEWVRAGAAHVETDLAKPPDFVPYLGNSKPAFTVKRLIDVFLYTQYAHQPCDRRSRQFQECLSEVGGNRDTLTFLFLTEVWQVAIEMSNVGQHIMRLLDVYVAHHKPASDLVESAAKVHAGIGILETSSERQTRILQEKANELALALWREAGSPAGGANDFFDDAMQRLRDAMGS